MKKLHIIVFLVLVVLVIAVAAIYSLEPQEIEYSQIPDGAATAPVVVDKDAPTMGEKAKMMENEAIEQLFQSEVEGGQYSNIVGTFAYEAFAWYVPSWLAQNWEMKQDEGKGISVTFSPKTDVNLTRISPITFYIEPSSENFNAATMYENESGDSVLLKEVLLSQHKEGMLQISIEPETRIYHIQTEAINAITDLYMLDGNGYTLRIVFWADKEIFPRYANKIRDMVGGIGEVKAPRG